MPGARTTSRSPHCCGLCSSRSAPDEHRLYLALHHLIFDGVSLYRVALPELIALYGEHAGGPAADLPAPTPYADFVAWERAELARPSAARHLEFHRRRLADAPLLELPLDRPRPPRPAYRGAIEPIIRPGRCRRSVALDRRRLLGHALPGAGRGLRRGAGAVQRAGRHRLRYGDRSAPAPRALFGRRPVRVVVGAARAHRTRICRSPSSSPSFVTSWPTCSIIRCPSTSWCASSHRSATSGCTRCFRPASSSSRRRPRRTRAGVWP